MKDLPTCSLNATRLGLATSALEGIALQKSIFANDQILRAVGATFVYKM
jgi:hypothetical protein